jgi:hypothetical protein
MVEFLLLGVALLTAFIVIITYMIATRYRIKMTVEKGLQEARSQPVTIIEAGSNFTTRMTDFKKSIDRLNAAMDQRNALLKEFQGNDDSDQNQQYQVMGDK